MSQYWAPMTTKHSKFTFPFCVADEKLLLPVFDKIYWLSKASNRSKKKKTWFIQIPSQSWFTNNSLMTFYYYGDCRRMCGHKWVSMKPKQLLLNIYYSPGFLRISNNISSIQSDWYVERFQRCQAITNKI